MNGLKSEKVVVSAPLSFSGSALRIWKITHANNRLTRWLVLAPFAVMIIGIVWMFVLCWYFVVYGLFGILFIPYRLIRRSGRKQKRDKLRHRELLETMSRSQKNG